MKRQLIIIALGTILSTSTFALCIDSKYCEPATPVSEGQIPPMANLMWSIPMPEKNAVLRPMHGPFSKGGSLPNNLGTMSYSLSADNSLYTLIFPKIGSLAITFKVPGFQSYTAIFTPDTSAASRAQCSSGEISTQTPLVNIFNQCNINALVTKAWGSIASPILKGLSQGLFIQNNQLMGYAKHDCGGTVIGAEGSNFYVLTAAHCVTNKSLANTPQFKRNPANLTVTTGTIWGKNLNSPFYTVKNISVNPNYENTLSTKPAQHDFALLTVNATDNTMPSKPFFKLTSTDYTHPENIIPVNLYVAGWGETQSNLQAPTPEPSTTLLKGQQDFIPPEMCHQEMKLLGLDSELETLPLCAGTTYNADTGYGTARAATCPGDSGGPLFYEDSKTKNFIQIGIDHSNAIGCISIPQPALQVTNISPTVRANVAKLCNKDFVDNAWFSAVLPTAVYNEACQIKPSS